MFVFDEESVVQCVPQPVILDSRAGVSIRSMSKSDLQLVLDWSAKEGWNPGKHELEPFYAINPKGYMLLTIDDEPVACLLNIRYSQNYAFMGLYIVQPKFRGKGYGKMLWDFVMNSLADCKTVGFSGVLGRVEDYKKSGFVPYGYDTRWYGLPVFPQNEVKSANHISIKKITDILFEKLVDYDARVFAVRRENFLVKWFAMSEAHALVAVDDNDVICGYGVISATTEGYKIAPLYAESESIAEKLFGSLCRCVGNIKTIYIDTAESNPSAATLVRRAGLEKILSTMRMYRGQPPETQNEKMFGLTALELG